MTLCPELTQDQHRQLIATPTATLASVLSKLGGTNAWIRGATPLATQSGDRIAGPAYTLRFSPARVGLELPVNTRLAIEGMTKGCVAVADTGNVTHVGVVGDVLSLRMKYLGVAGLVTDGAVRDAQGISESGLAVWSAGAASPLPTDGLVLVGIEEIVRCGGVTICPGDIIVADLDGVIVVPRDLLATVLERSETMEKFEQWVMLEVKRGVPLPGLYPPDEAAKQRYEFWLNEQF